MIYLNVNLVPRDSLKDFEFVAFDVEAKEIHPSSSNCQENGVKREALN
jgi:hypothetical protein